MLLTPITPDSHGVELALAYATADNFTGRPIYRRALAYLRPEAAGCLARAGALAARQGLRFRLYDAFRPSEAQWALWAVCPDPTYVADPRRGSPHTRGVAVDLTLIDRQGRALEMGTPFDSLDPASHHEAPGLAAEVERNRLLLLGIMTAAGFDWYVKEWWHYQLFRPRRLPVLSDRAAGTGMMAGTAP